MPATFLWGIFDLGDSVITHAVGEVYLQGRWVQTDTYVTDSTLDAHGQYHHDYFDSLPFSDWGVSHDLEHFYANQAHPELHMSWLTRAKWVVAASVINRRARQLRSKQPVMV